MAFEHEELEVLYANGTPSGEKVSAKLCHEEGLWHLAIVIFVLTEWGEVVLKRRAAHELVEPGRWGILEAHVQAGSTSEESALRELSKLFKLHPNRSRLATLTPEGAVLEYCHSAAGGISDREHRTLYAYTLSWEEYQVLQEQRSRLVQQVSDNGANRSPCEGASHIRFVSAKDLLEETETSPMRFTSGTLAVFRDPPAHEAIVQFWTELINQMRARVVKAVLKATGSERVHRFDDSILMDAVVPQPEEPAAEFEVRSVFDDGKNTCPGAYRIGEMIATAGHLKTWNEQLFNPYDRYVEEDLEVLRRSSSDPAFQAQIDSIDTGDACRFVRDILLFPLEDGTLLRTRLGRLEEITACRYALRSYLLSHTLLPEALINNPQGALNNTCNRLVNDIWAERCPENKGLDNEAIRRLIRLDALLEVLDFDSPEFQGAWANEESIRTLVNNQFDAAAAAEFSPALGGDAFLDEFLDRWLSPSRPTPTNMVYLTSNNGQLVISLKCIESFLRRQSNLTIILVPKNGQYGNNASWKDVENLLDTDAHSDRPIYQRLRGFLDSGRLVICHDGPGAQGLNPRCFSRKLCSYLRNANVVFAEGRAYAEIRGWLKPTYLLFQVKGGVAEAVHGVDQGQKALGFLYVGSGAVHYSQRNRLPQRVIHSDRQPDVQFHAWGQTTVDYVKAVLSDNYQILRDRIFNGKEQVLLRRLREESDRLGKSMAHIVLGTQVPDREEVQRYREAHLTEVFAIGGGGGFNQVTLKALQMLGVRVAAGVPATDDGGSTGKLQKMIADTYGHMFGVGDAAAILEQQVVGEAKRPILSFRPPAESNSLTEVLIEQIIREASHPTIDGQYIPDCPDFLFFVCDQLNLARVIDAHFLGANGVPGFSIKGASIRNLNILAAFHLCGAISREAGRTHPNSATDEDNAERAWFLLESALGLAHSSRNSIRTLPVSYDRAVLWATYSKPIHHSEIKRLNIPEAALSQDRKTVYGQQYIDQILPTGKVVDFGLIGSIDTSHGPLPRPSNTYLEALKTARLCIMGAGSLFGSQLAQLAVPGVLDELIRRKDIRKVLVVNHVCMDETMFYSLTDHIKAIERLASKVVDGATKHSIGRSIQIGDIFTDIVVPRTVAREIDVAIAKEMKASAKRPSKDSGTVSGDRTGEPIFVALDGSRASSTEGILLNRYVAYLLRHRDFRTQYHITDWELRVLSFLDQPPSLYRSRSEAGRYRGAVYALESDIEYLINHGIPRRHIYEAESIAMNVKILKAEGKPQLEEFPGLIPESLVGIFKILLAKGTLSV